MASERSKPDNPSEEKKHGRSDGRVHHQSLGQNRWKNRLKRAKRNTDLRLRILAPESHGSASRLCKRSREAARRLAALGCRSLLIPSSALWHERHPINKSANGRIRRGE